MVPLAPSSLLLAEQLIQAAPTEAGILLGNWAALRPSQALYWAFTEWAGEL